ncbi:hypothetical protein ACWEOE_25900 [Amycolatopsis sp. NPDC004368]
MDLVLLTDADILHGPRSLETLVIACGEEFDLVSQMALLRAEVCWCAARRSTARAVSRRSAAP